MVCDQNRTGDKCDIIRQRYTEEAIPGFVLVELVSDTGLCEKIYDDSGLDLRDLTAEQAQDRLHDDQDETAEALEEIRQQQDGQERNVSTDPVWKEPDSGNDNTNTGGGGGGSTPPAPPPHLLTPAASQAPRPQPPSPSP